MKTSKLLLTGLILTSLAGTTMAANQMGYNNEGAQILGDNNRVQFMRHSILVGNETQVGGTGLVAVGNNANAAGHDSVAIGDKSSVNAQTLDNAMHGVFNLGIPDGKGNVSIGVLSSTGIEANTAIGYKSYAASEVAVALGAYSQAGSVNENVDKKYAGTSNNRGVVSVGSSELALSYDPENSIPEKYGVFTRQIRNLGAGEISAESTDAVNGSQLNDAFERIGTNKKNIKDLAVGVQMLGDAVADNTTTIANMKHTTVSNGDNIEVAKTDTDYKVSLNKYLTDMRSATFHSNGGGPHPGGDTDITGLGVHTNDLSELRSANMSPDKIYVRVQNDSQSDLKSDEFRIEKYSNDGNKSMLLNTDGLYVINSSGRAIEYSTNNIDAGNQQIHGVTAGTADTDAVNVSQLKDIKLANNIAIDWLENHEARINGIGEKVDKTQETLNNHEGRITTLENKVTDISSNAVNQANHYTDMQVAKVGANAAALSALHPLDYNPDHKTDIMAGVGHYKGKTAVALGVAHRPNENTMVTFGTTINGKDTMINAGVSYKVGAKGSTYKSPLKMAKEIDDLKVIVDKLLKDNQELHKALENK